MICLIRRCIIVSVVLITLSCSKTPIETFDIEEVSRLIDNAGGNATSFLFFTDPHLNENNTTFSKYLTAVESVYSRLPLEFCLCGGDWLNSGDTNQQAYDKLKFINDYTYGLFGENYYSVLGNHDTNYQGRKDEGSNPNTGLLSRDEINELLFSKQGNSFYSFNSGETKIFVFDTGLDWYPQMDEYKWSQVYWFAEELMANDYENIIVAMHMYANEVKTPVEFSRCILEVAEAHNYKRKISINGKDYDFMLSHGLVACILCGHCHEDFVDYSYSIPVIGTTHLKAYDVPTYDLCIFNWQQHKLNLMRVGAGYNREIDLACER